MFAKTYCMIKESIEYLQNNPKCYWFKAKIYGFGYDPATKEGFILTFLYIFLVVSSVIGIGNTREVKGTVEMRVAFILIITSILILICIKKVEKPAWR